MCTHDHGGSGDAVVSVIDDILRLAHIEKAINPLNPKGFLVIQQRIARSLAGATRATEAEALRKTLRQLDVDWPNLSAAGREEVIRAARSTLRTSARRAAPKVEETLRLQQEAVAGATRSGVVAQFRLRIPSSLSLRDERLAAWCSSSQALFVRDRLGDRADSLSERARQIVAGGLDSGLGRDAIVERLSGLVEQGMGGSLGYWQVVAGAFVGRTRSAINVSSFAEAGVKRFRVEAVLDEVTSEICRLMHGKEFSVAKASARLDEVAALEDPEEVRNLLPWVNTGKGEDGKPILYHGTADDPKVVATIKEPGVGEKDRIGTYGNAMSDDALQAAGITMPPYHGLCRTTIVAVV